MSKNSSFSPSTEVSGKPDDKTPKISTNWLGSLKYVVKGNEGKFALVLISSVLANAFVMAFSPFVMKFIFDEGIIRGDFRSFIILAVVSVLVFTLWRIWVYLNRLYVQKLKVEISGQISKRLISKYYEISYNEVSRNDSGYFVSRIYDEAASTCHPTIDTFISLFSSIATLIVATFVVLAMSWRASLSIVAAFPLIYLVTRTYANKIKNLSKDENEKQAVLKGVITKSVNSFKFVNVFNLKSTVLEKIGGYYDKYAEATILRFRSASKYETINGTLMSYTETIATIGAGYEILVGRMTFGSFMGFMQAYWGVIGSVRGLFGLIPELSRLTGAVERLMEFEQNPSERNNITESDSLQLNQMSFSYGLKSVLENITINPAKSEKILVIGSNGSGKSTFAHIVSGFLSPTEGKAKTFPLSRISAVIYPSEFIPGTVRDNFSFIDSASEKFRFNEIGAKFNLLSKLDKDPSELSAGQRKKLEIMMGLVKESDLYIFDEPLAGIDVESKERIMSEIFKYTKGKILIVVMHGDEQFHHHFDSEINLNKDKVFYRKLENRKLAKV
ncbi:MAG: ABC transporter ATP-binding protein/permease [Pyrinomonadaceae bacterium]|nr:ABC transporter ATP-binding protein/permease [Pyrinomonadaceae bacterium]